MPSQGSQEPLPVGPLCLPLAKLSYATVSNDSISPIPWIHLSSKHNLFAIFETRGGQDSSGQLKETRIFKVLRDPEVVAQAIAISHQQQENIDLDKLASGAQQALAEVQDPKSRDRMPQIAVIVKAPVIAIRYPMSGGQVRRFQIRFANEEDYYETMKMFSRAKVPTGDAGSMSTRRPESARSASSTNLQPSDSVPQTGSRPASVSSGTANQSSILPILAGQASQVSPSNNTGLSMENASMMPPPEHPPGHEYALHQQKGSDYNQYSSFASSQATPYSQASHITTGVGIYDANVPGLPPTSTAPDYTRCSVETTCSAQLPPSGNPLQPAINMYKLRPLTEPVIESQHFSQELPPKRELPFLKSSLRNKSDMSNPTKEQRGVISEVREFSSTSIASQNLSASTAPAAIASVIQPMTAIGDELIDPTPAAKRRKVAPTKKAPKAPAVKKSRAPAPRKKPSALRTAKENLELSVEKLLKHSEAPSKNAESEYFDFIENGRAVGPNLARSKPPAFQKMALSSLPVTSQESAASAGEDVTEHPRYPRLDNSQNSQGKLDSNTLGTIDTCQNPKIWVTRNQILSQNPTAPTSKVPLVNPSSHSTSNPATYPSRCRSPSPLALVRDPAFNSFIQRTPMCPLAGKENTNAWARLSHDQLSQNIEAWVVDQIGNPEFEKLCSVIEGCWKAQMVL